ncbi:MAG: cysteine hydrolase [Pigmentiphaga sp.]
MHRYQAPDHIVQRSIARRGNTALDINKKKTALIVVDMQNYFVDESFAPQSGHARGIVGTINHAAMALREQGGLVVWVQTTAEGALRHWGLHHAEGLTPALREKRLAGLDEQSPGHALYPGLDRQPEDLIVKKIKFSAFAENSSDLDVQLRERGIDTVAIAGTLTNVCCDSTARDAMMKNYRSIMLSDANATLTDEEHAAALNTYLAFFGPVMTVAALIEAGSLQRAGA